MLLPVVVFHFHVDTQFKVWLVWLVWFYPSLFRPDKDTILRPGDGDFRHRQGYAKQVRVRGWHWLFSIVCSLPVVTVFGNMSAERVFWPKCVCMSQTLTTVLKMVQCNFPFACIIIYWCVLEKSYIHYSHHSNGKISENVLGGVMNKEFGMV